MISGDRLSSGTQALQSASPRLFRNPVLDWLSRVHHFVPLLVYIPLLAALLVWPRERMPGARLIAALAGGYLLWTLVEYLGHRLLFHYRPRSPAGRRIHFLIHGVHHDHPSDPLRLVMPPLMSLPIIAVAGAVLWCVLGFSLSMPALAGFVVGYLAYDMLHFHMHHAQPRSALGRLLRYRHMYHHFRDDSCWFGVSAPWWDAVFGTRPAGRDIGSRKPAACPDTSTSADELRTR